MVLKKEIKIGASPFQVDKDASASQFPRTMKMGAGAERVMNDKGEGVII